MTKELVVVSTEAGKQERRNHMLGDAVWSAEQTSDILLHQIRPILRYNTVSPLAALAALQGELVVEGRYLSK